MGVLWVFPTDSYDARGILGPPCRQSEKQKKPGTRMNSGFPGIDEKTALQNGRLFLYQSLRFDLVPLTGLEPVRYCYRGILSPLCLPIPPQRHKERPQYTIFRPAMQDPFFRIFPLFRKPSAEKRNRIPAGSGSFTIRDRSVLLAVHRREPPPPAAPRDPGPAADTRFGAFRIPSNTSPPNKRLRPPLRLRRQT